MSTSVKRDQLRKEKRHGIKAKEPYNTRMSKDSDERRIVKRDQIYRYKRPTIKRPNI